MKQFSIEFNRDYGIDRRTGWSITLDGCVLVQLEPWLIVALWKAVRQWRRWNREHREFAKRIAASQRECDDRLRKAAMEIARDLEPLIDAAATVISRKNREAEQEAGQEVDTRGSVNMEVKEKR